MSSAPGDTSMNRHHAASARLTVVAALIAFAAAGPLTATEPVLSLELLVRGPHFEANGLLYVHYSAPDDTGDPQIDHFTTISRFTVDGADPNQVDPSSEILLLRYA